MSRLFVLSHLRWNFVYQRPQHIISRLANDWPVTFVEEPLYDADQPPHWDLKQISPQLTIATPRTPIQKNGFCAEQMACLQAMIPELISDKNEERVAWLYTPLAVPLVDLVRPAVTVYDCMDALTNFLNAPPELVDREAELLRKADLVFTGGTSLFRRLEHRHERLFCFPSSVDAEHFRAATRSIEEPSDLTPISHPRLGYVGVIDERIDLGLLDHLARSRPEWQIVMVGPVVKIDPQSLPRHANLHYLGAKSYAELPAYLGHWDVCLQPFALNDATRFISPTKVLEYMAAEKPIVSTPITDVVEPYGEIVYLANSPEEFVACCERALEDDAGNQARRSHSRSVLSRTSWDRTVAQMVDLVEETLTAKLNRSDRTEQATDALPSSVRCLVVGGGPTGLSAAYHLPEQALLLEQNDRIGGWCRSIERDGFTFDFAGHIMFSADPYVHELYKILLGDNVHWQDREAWIYSKQVYTRYPFQGALYGLPPQVIKECILGAIEARFGTAVVPDAPPGQEKASAVDAPSAKHNGNGHPRINGHKNGSSVPQAAERSLNGRGSPNANPSTLPADRCLQGDVKDCCGDGVLESSAPLKSEAPRSPGQKPPPANFEEFIYRVWGAGIARHFAIPYNRKLWAVPLTEMETSWLGGRVPMPELGDMIEGALQPVPKPMGPNARFGYPLRGGFQALMNGFLPHLEGRIRLHSRVVRVSPSAQRVTLADGTEFSYRALISTMPLPLLVKCIGDEAPDAVHRAAEALRYVSVRCVNLGIGREKLTEKHWIYYPEDTVFHRIFVQGNASPHCNPPGGFGLTCEITYSPHKPLPCDGEALIQRCIEDCRQVGIIRADDPVWTSNQVDMPFAYVVYDHVRPENVRLIREWLAEHDIILAGRYSEWEYYNSDHAFIAGKKAAETARQILASATDSVRHNRDLSVLTPT